MKVTAAAMFLSAGMFLASNSMNAEGRQGAFPRLPPQLSLSSPRPTPTMTPAPCPGDLNGDRKVTIAEVVRIVRSALNGCP